MRMNCSILYRHQAWLTQMGCYSICECKEKARCPHGIAHELNKLVLSTTLRLHQQRCVQKWTLLSWATNGLMRKCWAGSWHPNSYSPQCRHLTAVAESWNYEGENRRQLRWWWGVSDWRALSNACKRRTCLSSQGGSWSWTLSQISWLRGSVVLSASVWFTEYVDFLM